MTAPTLTAPILEPAAQAFADVAATPPFLYELTPAQARKVLDDVQSAPIDKLPVDEQWITVPASVGDVRVRMLRPPGATGPLPVVVYMHGGGWVLGNAGTHDRLVRELVHGSGAALAFVEYDRSPQARFPVAIEQGYAVAQHITREGARHGLDPTRMAVAGDSVGGCMTAALTLMAEGRGDVCFVHQSLYYPVTDAAMDTASDQQLAGLPPALVIVDECDVLRDEGEAYAGRLRANGIEVTTVRYDGTIHDFMMLNPLAGTRATRAAIGQACAALREALR